MSINYFAEASLFNSFWSGYAIRWHKAGSTLALLMACCSVNGLLLDNVDFSSIKWHSSESNFKASASAAFLYNEFENDNFLQLISRRNQWATSWNHNGCKNSGMVYFCRPEIFQRYQLLIMISWRGNTFRLVALCGMRGKQSDSPHRGPVIQRLGVFFIGEQGIQQAVELPVIWGPDQVYKRV